MATAFPLEIFYDGSCLVCRSEMETYRRENPQNRLRFIDISATDFAAEKYGKSESEFMDKLHVRDAEGNFSTGVDAFMLIWQAYPSGSLCRLLGAVIGLPGINLFSHLGYRVFARYRHLLPKRKQECDGDTCRL